MSKEKKIPDDAGVVVVARPQKPFQAEEVAAVIAEAVAAEMGQGVAAMGKVMAAVKLKLAGRADMAQVSAQVKALLKT